MRQRRYFVAGATGKQGGAVARQLLARGHRVRIYTRNPGGPQARLLQRLGAELFAGGFDDPGPLERALHGCDGAFGMSCFTEGGVEVEVRQARRLVDAVQRAGVPHLVHGSIAGADRITGVAHLDSKFLIERHLAHAGIRYTIVAPVFLMENWLAVIPSAVARGAIRYPLPPGRVLQMVAVDDVAAFVRLALERSVEFEHRRVEIAGDALTMERIAAVLGEAVRRPLAYRAVPLEGVWARSEELGRLCAWLDREGTRVDVDRLRTRYRDLGWTRLETWARRQDWRAVLGPAAGEAAPASRAWALAAR